jgi:hypothetical protein
MRPIVKEYITIIIIGVLCLFLIISFIGQMNPIKQVMESFSSDITAAATYPGTNIDTYNTDLPPTIPCGSCDGGESSSCDVVINPNYLQNNSCNKKTQTDESSIYAQNIIDRQAKQIRNMRESIVRMANEIDNQDNMFYRRKLNNKNYKPKPFLASTGQSDMLNLYDDDFSNKTLSTIKFLAQTRESKYFGDEVHFPSELCGNYCSTSDPNRAENAQIDGIRPFIAPTSNVQK